MRLAYSWGADEAKPFRDRRKLVREALRMTDGAEELLVGIGNKGFQLAAAVPRWDARLVELSGGDAFTPAVTPDDPPNAIGIHGLPAGVVADTACHRGTNCNPESLIANR
jgi:hypothetical protein